MRRLIACYITMVSACVTVFAGGPGLAEKDGSPLVETVSPDTAELWLVSTQSLGQIKYPVRNSPNGVVTALVTSVEEMHQLFLSSKGRRELVWEHRVVYPKSAPHLRGFRFWDAESVGDDIYVIYSASYDACVEILQRDDSKEWRSVSRTKLSGGRFSYKAVKGEIKAAAEGVEVMLHHLDRPVERWLYRDGEVHFLSKEHNEKGK